MANIIAYPFRITSAGRVATVPQGGEAEAAQIVTVASSTLLGERHMAETWGIPDPAFVGLDESDLAVTLADHGYTQISIEEVVVVHPTETTMQAEVRWRLEEDDVDDEESGEL